MYRITIIVVFVVVFSKHIKLAIIEWPKHGSPCHVDNIDLIRIVPEPLEQQNPIFRASYHLD